MHGTHFESSGKISLHAGQPCTPQIMFDFRGTSASVVWLAAPAKQSKVLTEAARKGARVHIAGVWRKSRAASCSYVEVTKVTVEKKHWGIF